MPEYMFESGFLGSRTLLYMDCIALYMAFLPIFVGIAVSFVSKGYYKLHQFTQSLLFFITLLSVGLFFYEVYIRQNLDHIFLSSSFSSELLFPLLKLYIVLVILTLILWFTAITFAKSDRKRRALPGLYSSGHKKSGRRVGLAIFLTSILSSVLYWMFFVA